MEFTEPGLRVKNAEKMQQSKKGNEQGNGNANQRYQ